MFVKDGEKYGKDSHLFVGDAGGGSCDDIVFSAVELEVLVRHSAGSRGVFGQILLGKEGVQFCRFWG